MCLVCNGGVKADRNDAKLPVWQDPQSAKDFLKLMIKFHPLVDEFLRQQHTLVYAWFEHHVK